MLVPVSQSLESESNMAEVRSDSRPVQPASGNLEDAAEDGRSGCSGSSSASAAMKQLHQQLDELKDAPKEKERRRSRRLQQKESEVPPPSSSVAATSHAVSQQPTPRKKPVRQSRRGQVKKELSSETGSSQMAQVIYDDPEGRREKAKLFARIERWGSGQDCVWVV